MRKYPKYKASGVDWLGLIPSDWNTIKIKFTDTLIMGQSPESKDVTDYEKGLPFLQGNAEFTDTHPIPKNWCEKSNKIAIKDDLLLSVRAPVGALNVSDQTYGIGRGLCAIRAKKNDLRFLYYLLSISKEELNKVSTGTTFVAITIPNLSNIVIPKVNLPEQHAIVHFLDYKTGQIDSFIANRQKQVELLKEQKAAIINKAVTKGINPNAKMKDSGIEWIGKVPEHWSVTKLKFVSRIYGRIGFRGYTINDLVEKGEGAITISPSNMKANEMNFSSCTYISWFKYEESPEIKIFNGDVLFVKTGSTYGKVSMVEDLNEPATINPQILVFKNLKTNPMFFYHQLRSKLIQAHVKTSVIGGTIPTISQEKIGNYYFLLPSKNEQELIIEYIKIETKIIDELISKYQKQIDLMQEYRTSLISQAVTGKIDVREWQPKIKN